MSENTCPFCGNELYDKDPTKVLMSNPPKKEVVCIECSYRGYREVSKEVQVNKGILKYTDYKRQQAPWLQIQYFTNDDSTKCLEELCIEYYLNYLKLTGYKNNDICNTIEKYRQSIRTLHLINAEYDNNRQENQQIADNINELMDKLL
jgi:hypothetical protein